jgi:hypothetical protein
MADFSPQPQWHPPWSYFHQFLLYLLYPLVLLGFSLDLGFTIFSQMLYTPRDFIHQVQRNNNARYSYLQRQLHWSNAFYLDYTTILPWRFYQAFSCFMNSHGFSVASFEMLLPFTFPNGERNHQILR